MEKVLLIRNDHFKANYLFLFKFNSQSSIPIRSKWTTKQEEILCLGELVFHLPYCIKTSIDLVWDYDLFPLENTSRVETL